MSKYTRQKNTFVIPIVHLWKWSHTRALYTAQQKVTCYTWSGWKNASNFYMGWLENWYRLEGIKIAYVYVCMHLKFHTATHLCRILRLLLSVARCIHGCIYVQILFVPIFIIIYNNEMHYTDRQCKHFHIQYIKEKKN